MATDFQSNIDSLVNQFTAQVRQAVVAELSNAVANISGPVTGGKGKKKGTVSVETVGRKLGKGEKRSQEDLDAMQEKFFEYVASNPGLRIEQVNKALGTTTRDLQLPIRKLIADKRLKVKGEKRATTYFANK